MEICGKLVKLALADRIEKSVEARAVKELEIDQYRVIHGRLV